MKNSYFMITGQHAELQIWHVVKQLRNPLRDLCYNSPKKELSLLIGFN